MRLQINATGTRPLLMHNVQLASPFNSFAKEMQRLNAKRSKDRTEDERLAMARVEFEGSLYHDATVGPYLPSSNAYASFYGGAKRFRLGPKLLGGVVMMSDLELPLIYRGPRDVDGLWGAGPFGGSPFVDLRSVSSNPSSSRSPKVDRCRPIFREWGFEAEIEIDPDELEVEQFVRVVEYAGTAVGVGDYRQLYGRYSVTVTEL